jgi:UDP-2,3-diacylglucosamine pyrophosphatase LpxH
MPPSYVSVSPAGVPQFDELYAVSDLHMGGQSSFQIFGSGPELAQLIEHLRSLDTGRIALLINGDLVDFLAEPDARAFDPEGAVRKLDRIANDPAFKPVWDALRKFVRKKNRHLIITMGNHDLELALPWVRSHLVQLLTGDDAAAYARLTLAFEGHGYLCQVGNARVLGLHGNEVDTWNVTDHETIRRFGRDIQWGRMVDAWIPNAGTQLVIDVMNDVKKKYPFVDLLKPELEAVIPTLAAVAPDKRDSIRAAYGALTRLAKDKFWRATGFLGGEQDDGAQPKADGVTVLPGLYGGSRLKAQVLLDEAERRLLAGVDPITLVPDDARGHYLSVGGAIWRFIQGEESPEILREALEGLNRDRSFDWSQGDGTFRQLDEQVGSDVDVILAGHTHLERALPRTKGRGWYFNSGTWARLMKIESDVLNDQPKFAKLYQALQGQSMDALQDYVVHRRTAIAIRAGTNGTTSELLRWGSGTLAPVDNRARYVKN